MDLRNDNNSKIPYIKILHLLASSCFMPCGLLIYVINFLIYFSYMQETQHLKSSNGFLTCPPPENNPKTNTSSDPKEANANQQEWSNNQDNKGNDLAYVSQEGGFMNLMSKSPLPSQVGPVKRKGSSLGAKIKRLKIETEESMELKLNWEEAQSLLRAPSNSVPSVTVIDGNEFEEFEVKF
jgi:hypothetical protein